MHVRVSIPWTNDLRRHMAMRSNLLPKDCGFPMYLCSKGIALLLASTSQNIQNDDGIVGFSTISDLLEKQCSAMLPFGGNVCGCVCMLSTTTLPYPHISTTVVTYYNHLFYSHTNKRIYIYIYIYNIHRIKQESDQRWSATARMTRGACRFN